MDFDPQKLSHVWWKGALKSAWQGIPQGVVLGLLAAGVLFGVIAGMAVVGSYVGGSLGLAALHTASAFGGFLYSSGTADALAALSATASAAGATAATQAAAAGAAFPLMTSITNIGLIPIVLFNTALTAISNFMSGGKIAVSAYKGDVEHRMNEVRISQLELREKQLETRMEQEVGPSRTAQAIIAAGPRGKNSFAESETTRAANAPTIPTIH